MDPATASNLSSPLYGYDFVVAVTQSSLNSEIKNSLDNAPGPLVSVIFSHAAGGSIVIVDYEGFKKFVGFDPLSIPDGTTDSDNRVARLRNSGFALAFTGRLGIPDVDDFTSLPDIIRMTALGAQVQFNSMWNSFEVISLITDAGSHTTLKKDIQHQNSPWIMSMMGQLKQSVMSVNSYATLPAGVQEKISQVSKSNSPFNVRQLLPDFSGAKGSFSLPFNSGGINSVTAANLQQGFNAGFLSEYLSQMAIAGQSLGIGCSIVMAKASIPASSLTLTEMSFESLPYLGTDGHPIPKPTQEEQDTATLNYLCTVDGNILSDPSNEPFSWNWVSLDESENIAGVVSINRLTFAKWFEHNLESYVASNCLQAHVLVTLDGLKAAYQFPISNYNKPTQITIPPDGDTLLSFQYWSTSSDRAGKDGWAGYLEINDSYRLTVDLDIAGSNIVVTQHQVVYVSITEYEHGIGGANLVDNLTIDKYFLSLDSYGAMAMTHVSTTTNDKSFRPEVMSILDFFTHFSDLVNGLESQIRNLAFGNLRSLPGSNVQNFVFPGNKTWMFSDLRFSKYGDLLGDIVFVDEAAAAVGSKKSGVERLMKQPRTVV